MMHRPVRTVQRLPSSARSSPRPPPRLIQRCLATSEHPLAKAKKPAPSASGSQQIKGIRWSTGALMSLAVSVGTGMYLIGRSVNAHEATRPGPIVTPNPSQKQFDAALKAVQDVLPPDCVSTDRQDLFEHGTSAWSYHKVTRLPGAVLYPRSTEDVVEIVKIASKNSIPLIPYAGGTSLEGHFNVAPAPGEDLEHISIPDEDLRPGFSFTLDFSVNMNRIVAVHEKDLDAVVQPGVGYEVLNEELKERGVPLFFPVDPGPGAQFGGMIGTGGSGTNAVRYGTMRENVINLTVVTADGKVLKTRSRARKSSAGPNLTQLFIGAEGTLGIVTEATVRLQPVLPFSVGVSSFETIRHAADAVAGIVQAGVGVACVELLDDEMMKAINASGSAGQWEEKPSLFIKFSGSDGQIKHDKQQTAEIIKRNGGSKPLMAKSESEAENLWTARKVALWSTLDYVKGSKAWTTDVCVPISKLPELVERTKSDITSHNLTATIVSHAGDGNFHCLICFRNDEELERTRACVHRMVEHAQDLDGTCTGEHGVGLGKMWALEGELGKETVGLLRSIKKTLDPQNIFNPGHLVPPEDAPRR